MPEFRRDNALRQVLHELYCIGVRDESLESILDKIHNCRIDFDGIIGEVLVFHFRLDDNLCRLKFLQHSTSAKGRQHNKEQAYEGDGESEA